jgi:hypothetical protein
LIEGIEQATRSIKDPITPNTSPTFELKYGLSPDLDCPDLISASLVANITVARKSRGHAKTNLKEAKLTIIAIPTDPEFRVPSNGSLFVKQMISAAEDRRKRQVLPQDRSLHYRYSRSR